MSTQPAPTRKGRSCCLGAFVLACLVLVLVSVFSKGSESQLRYSGAQDLVASQDFEQVFIDLGIEGVEVIVITSRGDGGAVLIIKMDGSKGFTNTAGAGLDGVLYALTDKIEGGNYEIDYMSLGYIGPFPFPGSFSTPIFLLLCLFPISTLASALIARPHIA